VNQRTSRRVDQQPADTTMMGVVHDALRRDLVRLQASLERAAPSMTEDRRTALAEHAEWMMAFLRRHHQGEDDGLFPMLRQRSSQARLLLDSMHADHERILPHMAHVERAERDFAGSGLDRARADLLDAVRALSRDLLPHLKAEELEAMPLVSAHISAAEWRNWDQQHNIKGRSLSALAMDGHWLMDGLDPTRYQVLIHLVPPPARVVIIKGYGRRYRRVCARRWGADVPVGPLRDDSLVVPDDLAKEAR
jgi:hypothetical protein